ncbi:MAG: hypothetical protein HY372_01460 [Candidatus Andersenbacteria bacterium]|nr:hypothetical protein [Candidatus Andersenbacteria bacterium]
MSQNRPPLKLTLALLLGLVLILVLFSSPVRRYLATQVSPIVELQLNRKLKLTVDQQTQPGAYSFKLALEDPVSQQLLALSDPVTVNVTAAATAEERDKDSTDAGTQSAGGGVTVTSQATRRTFVFQAEDSSQVTGSWSGVRSDGQRRVVTLAHQGARLSRQVAVPAGNYWLDINAKHDRPGPVDIVVYLNNQAWKVIRLSRNDNVYRTHRIGLLKNFSGAAIQFRPLTDTFDRHNPTDENRDRNLNIDWWRLTTETNLTTDRLLIPAKDGHDRSRGWHILPRLNQIVREELGQRFISFDLWRYYARRLTSPIYERDAVQTEQHLRNIMRFWRGVRPDQPQGD